MKKRSNSLKILSFLIMVVVGGGVGFFVGRMGYQFSPQVPKGAGLLAMILFIPAFFMVIGFHELGHVLAGKSMNFDLRMYVAGPFMWVKEQTKLRFKWNFQINTAGGLVLSTPIGTENLRTRFSVFAFGGPLASLVLAALSYGVYSVLPVASQPGLLVYSGMYFSCLIVLLSLAIFVVTIIPLRAGGFLSDGARILRLQRGGDVSRFEVLILKIIFTNSYGVRPRLFDMSELEEAQSLAEKLNDPYLVYINAYFYQAAFDKGELEKAEVYLTKYVNDADSIPNGVRNGVWLEAAFFYAIAKQDLNSALLYWNKFKPSPIVPKAQLFATEAAISYLKNERVTAETKIAAALHELPNMTDRGLAAVLSERLLALKANME
jgi:hypothetical protein